MLKEYSVRRPFRSLLGVLSFLIGAAQSALAAPITLTFDEFIDGTGLTTQYQGVGVTVFGATTTNAINTPWPANTGANVAVASSGLMTFTLNAGIAGNIEAVSAYVSGITSVGIYAYDIGGVLVGQSVTPGATDNMFLSVTSTGNPIARVDIHDGGSSFAIDTLTFASAVPEPATVWLLGAGLLGLMGVARRKVVS